MVRKKEIKGEQSFLDYDYIGPGKKSHYFEGWYLKLMSADKSIAIIPSIHIENKIRTGHLQWIISSGSQQYSGGRSYTSDQVFLQKRPFILRLGENEFKPESFSVSEEGVVLEGFFDHILPFGSNIMGPFALFKNLPCIHGLQALSGKVSLTCQTSFFDGNYLTDFYCEKDRGTTFPERYLWLHCYFPEKKASLFFSIALVPLGLVRFEGHIANWFDGCQNHTFATYYGSRVKVLENVQGQIVIYIENASLRLTIKIRQGSLQKLKSPKEGSMVDNVYESMDSQIVVSVCDRKSLETTVVQSKRCSLEVNRWFDKKDIHK